MVKFIISWSEEDTWRVSCVLIFSLRGSQILVLTNILLADTNNSNTTTLLLQKISSLTYTIIYKQFHILNAIDLVGTFLYIRQLLNEWHSVKILYAWEMSIYVEAALSVAAIIVGDWQIEEGIAGIINSHLGRYTINCR